MKLDEFTLIVPFYRNCEMLGHQIAAWEEYPSEVQIILVDDGSPEPARDVLMSRASRKLLERVDLYRIGVDIPWNRGGARNLATQEAMTDWIVHVDIDHILPARFARELLYIDFDPGRWYRFERFRVGKADETRRKDKIADDIEFGKIHPHIDSYLCTRDLYWKAGGYDEDYSGCLGGGTPFLKTLEKVAKPAMVPDPIHLLVFTRSVARDASDHSLSRDKTEYVKRKREKERTGRTRAERPIRFPWSREDLCTHP